MLVTAIGDVARLQWLMGESTSVPLTCMPLMDATDGRCFSRSLMLCATRDFWKYVRTFASLMGLQVILGALEYSQ